MRKSIELQSHNKCPDHILGGSIGSKIIDASHAREPQLMQEQDQTLVCRDCAKEFLFTSGEQEFFALRGLTNLPKRCPNCRILSRLERSGKDPATSTELNCSQCDALTRVPFKPTQDKPVYCSVCLHQNKEQVLEPNASESR